MPSGGFVLVLHHRLQLAPEEEPSGIQRDPLSPTRQGVRNPDFDATVAEAPVPTLRVLAFEVGVDRHLGATASTDRGNEVEGSGAAAPLDDFGSLGGDDEFEGHGTESTGRPERDDPARRTYVTFEAPLASFAHEADPEGSAAVRDSGAAFGQDLRFVVEDSTLTSLVYGEQCAAFLAGFVDEFVAEQTG